MVKILGKKCKSEMGQRQVSGGVSMLCWLAVPLVTDLTYLLHTHQEYIDM